MDQVEGVLFASPSAVEGWFLSRHTHDMMVVAIGPTTAAALHARGIHVDGTAATPSPAALAAAMAALVEKRNLK
jgi:uroporphyrinogen-III synthase